jgi:two-component system LytT family sensor kinase
MKKRQLPTKSEWILILCSLPVFAFVLNYALFGDRSWKDVKVILYSYPIIIITAFGLWALHFFLMHQLRKKFTAINQTGLRVTLLFIEQTVLTLALLVIYFYGYDATNFLDYEFNGEHFRTTTFLVIALSLIITIISESEYTLQQWKDSLAEKERLQQLSLQQEFDSLKSQVNPHFLFNCFNTLSSLITEDKESAEAFLNELSKVYRYLLRNNRTSMTTLENELRFIHSYFQLLKTRHGGEALQLHIEVDRRYEQYILPSSSLQLLVENAVKHNIVSKSSPLIIDIFTAAGNILVVNNNLQTKQSKPMSTHIGLENIKTKYDLINQTGFQVLVDSKNFSVILPLIWCPVPDNEELELKENNIRPNAF